MTVCVGLTVLAHPLTFSRSRLRHLKTGLRRKTHAASGHCSADRIRWLWKALPACFTEAGGLSHCSAIPVYEQGL